MATTRIKYAEGTTVTPARSREELDKLLKKYGATSFGYKELDDEDSAVVIFKLGGVNYRFFLKLPQLKIFEFGETMRHRNSSNQKQAYEQAVRTQWRALIAAIKGKLIAVDNGIETFEEAFLRQIVLNNDQTVAEYIEPQLRQMYQSGTLPKALPGGK